jgi:hypothetical protein
MFIDFNNFYEFDETVNNKLAGQYVSPGYLVNTYNVSRQLVHNWIARDNHINAYRFNGKQGYFIAIPITEVEKIYDLKIKKILEKRKLKA